METMYRIKLYTYSDEITEVQVERSTESTLWVWEPQWYDPTKFDVRKHRRSSEHEKYFESRDAAITFLRERHNKAIAVAEETIRRHKDEMARLATTEGT